MLDKRQLEIVKGLIDMNLGEDMGEFEKPSSVIHDPVAQVHKHLKADVLRAVVSLFHTITLSFSLSLPHCPSSSLPVLSPSTSSHLQQINGFHSGFKSLLWTSSWSFYVAGLFPLSPVLSPRSLALFDIELSRFVFEARSDQSKLVDFTCHTVIGHDTRYRG